MQVTLILPAAGAGRRFFSQTQTGSASKVEMTLGDKPLFLRAIEIFQGMQAIHQILLAVPPERLETFQLTYGDLLSFQGVEIVAGGKADRWETVMLALSHVHPESTHVAVHDAARPLTSRDLVQRCLDAACRCDAVIPGQPVHASLKAVGPADGQAAGQTADPLDALLGFDAQTPQESLQQVVRSVSRENLVEVQTPQVFKAELLREAYKALAEGRIPAEGITDDAGLVQALGQPVMVVAGEPGNLKVTRPEDLELAEAIFQARQQRQAGQTARRRLFAHEDD